MADHPDKIYPQNEESLLSATDSDLVRRPLVKLQKLHANAQQMTHDYELEFLMDEALRSVSLVSSGAVEIFDFSFLRLDPAYPTVECTVRSVSPTEHTTAFFYPM